MKKIITLLAILMMSIPSFAQSAKVSTFQELDTASINNIISLLSIMQLSEIINNDKSSIGIYKGEQYTPSDIKLYRDYSASSYIVTDSFKTDLLFVTMTSSPDEDLTRKRRNEFYMLKEVIAPDSKMQTDSESGKDMVYFIIDKSSYHIKVSHMVKIQKGERNEYVAVATYE